MIFKNFIITFLLCLNFFTAISYTNEHSNRRLAPEGLSDLVYKDEKTFFSKDFIVVSANKYATDAATKVLKQGGNAADAGVSLQLILGLVEPQSSGIGGGSFALYYDVKKKKILNYDGREKAPKSIPENIFLKSSGEKINFFDAVVGGKSVGVPGTLATLKEIHDDYGILKWSDVIQPAIDLAEKGFMPPPRLLAALNKEKYLFDQNPNNQYFINIKNNPKQLVRNYEYLDTLKKISEDERNFYEGAIAKNITNKISNNDNPGYMSLADLREYEVVRGKPLCIELKHFFFCGPSLPSSGGVSIAQALILYENFKFKKGFSEFSKILRILDFVYFLRDKHLADPKFVNIDLKKLLSTKFLKSEFQKYFDYNKKFSSLANEEEFSSTSHFSIVDSSGNVLCMTSSIENGFGSRIYTDGFLLNNQLTDFSFLTRDNNINIPNRPEGGKKPLSSMSPIIILDKDKEFVASLGSPGGIAIISYVFKSIIDIFYSKISPMDSLSNGNYVKKNGKIYLENGKFADEIKTKLEVSETSQVIRRSLVSGLGVIIKKENGLYGYADIRRDGTVKGK